MSSPRAYNDNACLVALMCETLSPEAEVAPAMLCGNIQHEFGSHKNGILLARQRQKEKYICTDFCMITQNVLQF
jgi:hypothetical protein